MADWRDVMEARSVADGALPTVRGIRGAGRGTGIAVLVAGRAICLELRALGVLLDKALAEVARAD